MQENAHTFAPLVQSSAETVLLSNLETGYHDSCFYIGSSDPASVGGCKLTSFDPHTSTEPTSDAGTAYSPDPVKSFTPELWC